MVYRSKGNPAGPKAPTHRPPLKSEQARRDVEATKKRLISTKGAGAPFDFGRPIPAAEFAATNR